MMMMMMMIQRPDCSLSSPRSLFVSPVFIYVRPTVSKMMRMVMMMVMVMRMVMCNIYHVPVTDCGHSDQGPPEAERDRVEVVVGIRLDPLRIVN